MKKTIGIASVESKAAFQEKLLEKFVQDNLPSRRKRKSKIADLGNFSLRYKEVESCAAETPVFGSIEIFFETNNHDGLKRISVPANSRFFVLCTRDEMSDYKVTASRSLS